jgi:thymidylate synthase (FAD)
VINILDHGYLKFIESWGSDARIIEAARMSTDKGFLGWGPRCSECDWSKGDHEAGCSQPDRWISGDEKLLRYLYENKHSSPFEFAGLVIEVQAPIFAFREWQRHRTQSYAELSSRYAPLPDFNYVPTVERLMFNNKSNKQAGTIKGAQELTEQHALEYQEVLRQHYRQDQEMYDYALRAGVAKELARVHLPVGRYSRMRASANLRNWLLFLTLRMDKNAQFEIRQYANALGTIIEEKFPRTWGLFVEGLS